MMTHDEIMEYSAKARAKAAQSESGIWSAGTQYTAEELESGYESYIVLALESGEDPDGLMDFGAWCEYEKGIENKEG